MNPKNRAQEIIRKYDILSPSKLDIEAIANAENLIVEEEYMKEKLGKIIYKEGYGLIKINGGIQEPGQKRFTLAHEFGHYCNDLEFKMKMFSCGINDINNFKSHKTIENEANEFAEELLMHRPWFNGFIKERKVDMELIKDLSKYFNVSLTAAALRYAKIGKYPIAVVMSEMGNVKGETGKVKWSSINEYFPYKWVPAGYKLHEESSAFDYFVGNEVQNCADLVPVHTWFSEDFRCEKDKYLWEQNVVMKNYESVLTILWEK